MSRTAATLKIGESGVVLKFDEDNTAAKLLEMGLLPGSEVKLIRTAPWGCPLYLKIHGSYVALRKEEAEHVLLNS